jgi:PhnB protein
MQLSIHLTFGGQCEAAFRFYERVLGGTVSLMLAYGDSPMAAQAAGLAGQLIVHATLRAGTLSLGGGYQGFDSTARAPGPDRVQST